MWNKEPGEGNIFDTSRVPKADFPEIHPLIGGPWPRLLAFLIDQAILFGIYFPIAMLLARVPGGALYMGFLGFLLAVLYFTVFNSALAKGQTVGKRMVGLRVQDSKGESISLLQSFIRSLVLLVPLHGADILKVKMDPGPDLVSSVFVLFFGFAGSFLYLLIFNRATRQGLHDLAADTYVLRQPAPPGAVFPTMWKGHWLYIVFCFFLAAATSSSLSPELLKALEMQEEKRMELHKKVEPAKSNSEV